MRVRKPQGNKSLLTSISADRESLLECVSMLPGGADRSEHISLVALG